MCVLVKHQTDGMKYMEPPADAIAAVTHCNPYPWYATLRNGPPLVRDERLRVWIASQAGVVREALTNNALRVRHLSEPVPLSIVGTPAGEVFGRLVRMNDGAPHAAHRSVLQRALEGIDLRAVHATALEVANSLPADSLSDTCFDMPVRCVARLLGFANDEVQRIAGWMRDFVACLSPLSSADQLHEASEAASALMVRFEGLIASCPASQGTLLAAVQAHAPADRSPALLANLVGLLSQTCEATAGLLGNSLVALAREPALRRRLDSHWELLPALVDEVARHDPSIQNTRRFVAQPTTVAGIDLVPGDTILLLIGAANRDPTLNPAPATFELMRVERRTLGFGHGAHACPGQALAITVATAGLESLLSREVATDRLLERGWGYRPSVNARIPVFC